MEELREELYELIDKYGYECLSNPEIVKVSQKLDKPIAVEQRKKSS